LQRLDRSERALIDELAEDPVSEAGHRGSWACEESAAALAVRVLSDRKCLLKPDIEVAELCLRKRRIKRIIVTIFVCDFQKQLNSKLAVARDLLPKPDLNSGFKKEDILQWLGVPDRGLSTTASRPAGQPAGCGFGSGIS